MYMNEIIKFTLIFISILAVTYDILCGRSGLDQQVVGNKSNVIYPKHWISFKIL